MHACLNNALQSATKVSVGGGHAAAGQTTLRRVGLLVRSYSSGLS